MKTTTYILTIVNKDNKTLCIIECGSFEQAEAIGNDSKQILSDATHYTLLPK
jgi:hypothetical protein